MAEPSNCIEYTTYFIQCVNSISDETSKLIKLLRIQMTHVKKTFGLFGSAEDGFRCYGSGWPRSVDQATTAIVSKPTLSSHAIKNSQDSTQASVDLMSRGVMCK